MDDALAGYSVTIFAFGQTGAGKTFRYTDTSECKRPLELQALSSEEGESAWQKVQQSNESLSLCACASAPITGKAGRSHNLVGMHPHQTPAGAA